MNSTPVQPALGCFVLVGLAAGSKAGALVVVVWEEPAAVACRQLGGKETLPGLETLTFTYPPCEEAEVHFLFQVCGPAWLGI